MSDKSSTDAPAVLVETVARHNLAVLQAVMRKAGVRELDAYFDSEDGRRVLENTFVCDGKAAPPAPFFDFDVEGLQAAEEVPEGNDEEIEGWWRVPVATMSVADAVRTVCFDVLDVCDPGWAAGPGTAGSVRIGLDSALVSRHRRVMGLESSQQEIEPRASVLAATESIGSDGWDAHWAAEIERENFSAVLDGMARAGIREISVKLTRLPDGSGVAHGVTSDPALDAGDWPLIDQRVPAEAGEAWTERQPLEDAAMSLVRDGIRAEFPAWIGKPFAATATVTGEGIRIHFERRKLERGTCFLRAPAPTAGLEEPEGAGPVPE